jgi:hypothetical protein
LSEIVEVHGNHSFVYGASSGFNREGAPLSPAILTILPRRLRPWWKLSIGWTPICGSKGLDAASGHRSRGEQFRGCHGKCVERTGAVAVLPAPDPAELELVSKRLDSVDSRAKIADAYFDDLKRRMEATGRVLHPNTVSNHFENAKQAWIRRTTPLKKATWLLRTRILILRTSSRSEL